MQKSRLTGLLADSLIRLQASGDARRAEHLPVRLLASPMASGVQQAQKGNAEKVGSLA